MKQRVPSAWNRSRVILYLTAMIICGIGAYIILYYIPRLKTKTIEQIKVLYLHRDFTGSMELCNEYIDRYPNEPEGYLWLGRNYDGCARESSRKSRLRERCRQNAKNPYFSQAQREKFQKNANKIDVLLKSQENEDFAERALKEYQKAFELSSDWKIGIEIVESHIEAGRFESANKFIAGIIPKSNEEKAHHALVKVSLCSELEKQGKMDLQDFAKQCEKAIGLCGQVSEREMSEKLRANRFLPYLYLAKISERRKDFKQAGENYRKAVSILKKQKGRQAAAAYLDYGLFLHGRGKDVEAQKSLVHARSLEPSNSSILYELAKIDLVLWQLPEALVILNEALALERNNPKLPIYHRALSDKLWDKYRHHPDFQMIMGWPQQSPPTVEIQRELREAIYFIYKDDINAANLHCQSFFAKKDCYPANLLSLYCNLASKSIVMTAMKHWSDEKFLLVAGVACKSLRQTWQERYIKPDLKKCDENIEEDLSALRTKSSTLLTELYIVHCYFRFSFFKSQQKVAVFFPETIDLVEKALAKFATTPRPKEDQTLALLYYFKGFSHRRLEQTEEALRDLKQSTKLAPTNPFFRLAYAQTLAKAKKTREAAVELEKITDANDAPVLHYQAAIEYMSMLEYPQACEHFKRCVELSPSNYVTWYLLAKTYLLEGKHKQAIVTLENAYKNEGSAKLLNKMYLDDPEWEAIKSPELREELRRIWRTYQ